MRAVPALLGVALVLSLASLAYQQIRTQRQRDAEAIANLRRQLVEAEQAKLAALLQLKGAGWAERGWAEVRCSRDQAPRSSTVLTRCRTSATTS